MAKVVIHSNPGLANQIESAQWLRSGFKAHGIDAVVTSNKTQGADIHVVQGPHYAYSEWLGMPNVLFLNRCFYGDSRFDLSIGWLNPDGSREFFWSDEPRREIPELYPEKPSKPKKRQTAVYLADYGENAAQRLVEARRRYKRVIHRPHPAESRTLTSLDETFEVCDAAIGGSSTALVSALVHGLAVESHDPQHVVNQKCDRETLMARLSWADWNYTEIENGEFWDHLYV